MLRNSHLCGQSEVQPVAIKLGNALEGGGWVLEVDPLCEQVAAISKVEEGGWRRWRRSLGSGQPYKTPCEPPNENEEVSPFGGTVTTHGVTEACDTSRIIQKALNAQVFSSCTGNG